MGFCYQDHFEASSDTDLLLVCKKCYTHVSKKSLIMSDNFTGNSGPAYLVNNVLNYNTRKSEIKTMRTGDYLIRKIHCAQCMNYLGWKYMKSFNFSESYKESKYVIERKYLKIINFKIERASSLSSLRYYKNYSKSGLHVDYETYNTSDDDDFQFGSDSLSDDSDCDSDEKF